MKFAEFKDRIETIYKYRFNASKCDCYIFTCMGKSICIDVFLAKDEMECPNRILRNDAIGTMFMIHLPNGWTENDELPEMMEMKCEGGCVQTKPEKGSHLFCDYRKIPYRKTKGDAEKIIKAFDRFTERLKDAVVEDYKADNLKDHAANLVKEKRYAA